LIRQLAAIEGTVSIKSGTAFLEDGTSLCLL
jgi:hypothetical protein